MWGANSLTSYAELSHCRSGPLGSTVHHEAAAETLNKSHSNLRTVILLSSTKKQTDHMTLIHL